MEIKVTFCDQCNSKQNFPNSENMGRGFYVGNIKQALKCGWEKINLQLVCIDCVNESNNLIDLEDAENEE